MSRSAAVNGCVHTIVVAAIVSGAHAVPSAQCITESSTYNKTALRGVERVLVPSPASTGACVPEPRTIQAIAEGVLRDEEIRVTADERGHPHQFIINMIGRMTERGCDVDYTFTLTRREEVGPVTIISGRQMPRSVEPVDAFKMWGTGVQANPLALIAQGTTSLVCAIQEAWE